MMRQWFEGNSPVDGEDLERHDKWLCMMWPRLNLLRDLLSEDGVIFVSIDDNEQHHLRMMMDEVFGEENFVANIIWQKKNSPQNDARYFSDNHDFVLCWAKNLVGDNRWRRNHLPRTEKHNSRYNHDDNDGRGPWATDNLSVKTYSPDYDYPVVNPRTGQAHNPPTGRCWITNRETMQIWLNENRIYFGKTGDGRPLLKRYLKNVRQGIVPVTVWDNSEVGSTNDARKLILQIFHDFDRPFDNPKPVSLIDRLLRIATQANDIVLDSFAGSGTTAHAVLALNREDGGNRKFILVECEDYADNITAERVRRVINGVPTARDATLREGLGGEFTYCELGDPISIEGMLNGDLPAYGDVARMAIHNATGLAPDDIPTAYDDDLGLAYESDKTRYHLLYRADAEWLRGEEGALNSDKARRISDAAVKTGKDAIVFAPARYMSQRDLTDMGITFCQLPYDLTTPRLKSLQS